MHDNNINTLRFLGAFLVLFGHTFELCYGPGGGYDPISQSLMKYTAYKAKLPGLGVAMFFVLSGFLVTRSYQARHSLAAYTEARILRIYPALWVTLLLTVFVLGPAVTSLGMGDYFSHKGTWKYLTHNFWLFPDVNYRLPGVFQDNPRSGGVNGSLWTLPVEVRMYMIVAVLGFTGVLKRKWLFNLTAGLIVIFYFLAPEQFFLLHSTRHERLGLYFLLGALLYMNREMIRYHWLGVVLLTALAFLTYKKPLYNLAWSLWFTYLVMYLSFHKSIRLPDLAAKGDFSYGLYLYAFPVTQLLVYFFGTANPWLSVCGVFMLSLALAVMSWYLVENPAIRLKGVLVGRLARYWRRGMTKLGLPRL